MSVLVGGLALLVLLGPLVPLYGRVGMREAGMWRSMLLGTSVVGGSAFSAQLVDALAGATTGGSSPVGRLVFSVGCLGACPFFYYGLLHWNRIRSLTSDPGDWANGFGSILASAALGNLVVGRYSTMPTGWMAWQFQASLLVCAALVAIVGAAASLSVIGGLARDPRFWLVSAAFVMIIVLEGRQAFFVPDADRPVRIGWIVVASTLLACSMLSPGERRAHVSTPQSTIVGALVVLVAGVSIFVIKDEVLHYDNALVALYASGSILLVSARILRVVRDLAQLAQSRHEARTDELTGVANRRALISLIGEALAEDTAITLLIADLDRFKEINDRYGHAVGDDLLRQVSSSFASCLPEHALLARLGGDEFAVALVNDGLDVPAVAGAMAAAVAVPLRVHGQLLHVGVSIGVAASTAGMQSGEILRRADAAMYQAKSSGAGISVYDEALDRATRQRLELLEDLRETLRGSSTGQICVHYQPQMEMITGRVVGAEALVRWQHPELGLLTPDRFLDLAQDNQLMEDLTAEVMRQACAQALRWKAAGHDIRVAVNISITSLGGAELFALLEEVLSGGLDPTRLVLEITETSLMSDPERALTAMVGIIGLGCGISIDDYGTGYSSLSYLNELPATELKIDRSFTSRIADDARTAAIVAATVDLAHRLGLRIIAEGVEDPATLAMLDQLGCDETQGYLHSRPLPADEFFTWIQDRIAVHASDRA